MAIEWLDEEPPSKPQRTIEWLDEEPQPQQPPEEDYGVAEGVRDVVGGVLKGASDIGSTALLPLDLIAQLPGMENAWFGRKDRREAVTGGLQQMGVDPESGAFTGGRIAANIAGTAGIGGPAAGASMLTKILGGAAAGGAAAYMANPEDTLTGAAVGAALPPVLSGAGKLASNIAGMGSLDRARRALSEIIGADDIERARQLADEAAASGMPMTTAQALERLKNPVLANLDESIRGTAATGRESAQSARYYANLAAQQEADRIAQLEQLARAGNTEASEALRAAARQRLEANLGPLREAELGAANTARDVTQRLAPQIDSKQQAMVSMLQGQGRALTDEAQGAVVQQAGRPGWLGAGQFSQDMGEVADVMGRVKNLRQGERDFLQRQLDSLDAYGLRTLQPDAILSRIDSMLQSPKTGVSDVNQKVLGKVAEKVRQWSQGGAIDAKALYEIRKTTINETVDDLLRGNPKASKQYAASLTAQIRPLIDDAIENAGGTDWKRYITSYRTGLEGIDRLELLDNARQLYKNNPKAFMDLVKGESPETVRAIMSGKTGIQDALGSSTMKKLENVAGQIERDVSLKNLAGTKGADRALKQILEDESFVTKLPNLLNRYAVLANTAAKAGEMKINARMYSNLEKAMRDPKAFKQLIDTLPVTQRNQMVKFVFDTAGVGSQMAPAVAGAIVAEPE